MNYSLTPDKFLTDLEHDHFLGLLNKYSHPNLLHTQEFRDSTLLRVALLTGARAQEILNITNKDFDHATSRVMIRGLKKSDNRMIPIPKELFQNLLLLTEKNGGSRPFPLSYNQFRLIWQLWRPTKKKLHCLRHTFAIRLYRRTKDIRLVKLALGHRAISNTMIYLEFDDQDALFRILDPTPPQSPNPTPKTQPRGYKRATERFKSI